ncbi:MAG: hypothetical protein K0Q49_1797 [Haloplasmataceae bacterium]|jgi:hypothetical protein|nr:hypothetical protein [Haloplasmataceae bacterium]
MKYQCKIEINENLERVSNLYQDEKARLKWEKGLDEIEMIKGEPNIPGSKATLHFKFDNSQMEMTETIESNDMPNSLIALYEVEGVWNRCVNQFSEKEGIVSWVMETEFIFKEEMNIPKQSFINQTLKGMEAFREFVESEKKILSV